MKVKIFLILFLSVSFFSCMTPPANIVYFQDLDNYRQNIKIGNNSEIYEPVIKKRDELLITVSAAVLEQEAVAQFNLPSLTYLASGETNLQKSANIQTYIVDQDGAINFPVIGRIFLAGLTKSQAMERIKKSISNYINDPVINMRIISFRIIVLGEVRSPGSQFAYLEKMSILDAIGSAGDLTLHGDRKNILLIRENDNGTIDHVRFDLTSADLFTSPYYYLQQGDKIIVEPNKTRQLESKYGVADGYKFSIYSMIFSAVSIAASTIIAVISLRK